MSAPSRLEALLATALDSVSPADANAAIDHFREQLAGASGPATSYEAVLPEVEPERHLLEAVLPKLVYFLDCRGLPLASPPGVFVSLFAADRLRFFEAGPFVATLAGWAGLTLEELVRRHGAASAG